MQYMLNNNEKPVKEKGKDFFAKNLKDGAKSALTWAKETGELAKEKAGEAKAWVDEKTPEAMEKLEEAADFVKETAEETAEWADSSAKKTKAWLEAQSEANKLRKREYDLKTLRPIFEKDIPESFVDYPLINIVRRDELREKSEACEGALGFFTQTKDIDVINVFLSSFDKFSFTCVGDVEEGVYFANPYVPGEYIESNNYAKYLKEERVRELANIADSLGAKSINISFQLDENNSEEKKAGFTIKKGKGKAEAEAEIKLSNSLKLSIDQVSDFNPHNNPVRPNLVYYKDNNTIKDLIERRMRGAIVSNTYSVTYASVSMAKKKEAAKVDCAIKTLKLGAAQSLSVCYNVESRIRMSYRIEFEKE